MSLFKRLCLTALFGEVRAGGTSGGKKLEIIADVRILVLSEFFPPVKNSASKHILDLVSYWGDRPELEVKLYTFDHGMSQQHAQPSKALENTGQPFTLRVIESGARPKNRVLRLFFELNYSLWLIHCMFRNDRKTKFDLIGLFHLCMCVCFCAHETAEPQDGVATQSDTQTPQ